VKRMLRFILGGNHKRRKTKLPNPNYEYRIVFKSGSIEAIKRAKGWNTDADMARALGVTRAYVAMLKKTRATVTATVITRLAAQLGNIEGAWWTYYEIVPWGVKDKEHPLWNYEKFHGRIPYKRISLAVELRQGDYNLEKNT